MSFVGIIANPASGKDIRRIVAFGSVFDNQEKVRMVRRIMLGLKAVGVSRIGYMPDYYGIVERALEGMKDRLKAERLQFDTKADHRDSTKAATLLAAQNAGCIVTLGGDGTNRVVAKGAGEVPILPLSTGTNNVFSIMIEGTVAGLAAALVATGKVPVTEGTFRSTRLEVFVDNQLVDIALVDAVVCDDTFVGSRAVWKVDKIRQLFLNRSSPDSIGFSSIGGMLHRTAPEDPYGVYFELGQSGPIVTAPVAPGVIESVRVREQISMKIGDRIEINSRPCVVALDGERELEIKNGQDASVRVAENGPVVVDVHKTMAAAMRRGVFVDSASLLGPVLK